MPLRCLHLDPAADSGRHPHTLDFTIAGEDDWPRAVLVVNVD